MTQIKKSLVESKSSSVIIHTSGELKYLLSAVAEKWASFLKETSTKEIISVAFSGGRVADQLFSIFADVIIRKRLKKVASRVDYFWADERCVPPASRESNFSIAHKMYFEPLNICGDNIHRIKGEIDPAESARIAEQEFRETVIKGRGDCSLDLVLLGMGEDGHIASIFPGKEQEAMGSGVIYKAVTSPKPPPNRVTLCYQPLISARRVWVIITGRGKESAFHKSLPPSWDTPLGRLLKSRDVTEIFYYPEL